MQVHKRSSIEDFSCFFTMQWFQKHSESTTLCTIEWFQKATQSKKLTKLLPTKCSAFFRDFFSHIF